METLIFMIASLAAMLDNRPPVEDKDRFPSSEIASEAIELNAKYRTWLEANRPLDDHTGMWLKAMTEADALWEIWQSVANLHSVTDESGNEYLLEELRNRLEELRDVMGEEAYYAGRLPPPVPIWRFQRVD